MAVDKELLDAIGQLLDSKLAEALEPIKADVAKIDKIAPKINGLYESIVGTGEKFNRLDVIEGKVEDHDHRLFAVEESLRKAE